MTGFVTDRFRRAVATLIDIEGGDEVSNNPKDRGGLTKFGISQRSYPHLDIRNLTRADAVEIYHADFWKPVRGDQFANEAVAQFVFELGVHAGPGTAAKALQRALNGIGRPLSVDGHIGRATLAAADAVRPEVLLSALRREAKAHYEAIFKADPEQEAEFGNGWKNRIRENRQ